MSDPAGQRLGAALRDRYRVERVLGEGGMATVYLADDLKHQRQVALKVLKSELAAVVGAERFLAEIRTTANLKHPHILPLFDSGQADGFLYYVMPYVEGESLRRRLDREHQLSVDEAVSIATRVAAGLEHAHRQGVVHRDIKPANILLQDGEPLVADFGIALALGAAGGGRLTETGLSLGTPHYMSPEQATGERDVDARTDVYALASVLYEMLAGVTPFEGGSPQAVFTKLVTKEAEPVRTHRKAVPRNVDAAIRKGLEKVPADRFASAQAFGAALGDPSFRYREDVAAASAAAYPLWKRATLGLVGAVLALGGVGMWNLTLPEAASIAPVVRLRLTGLAPDHRRRGDFDVGPLGTGVVYWSTEGGLRYRRWDEPDGRRIAGLGPGAFWFQSRDGRYIFRVGLPEGGSPEIQRVPLEGDEPISRAIEDLEFVYPGGDGYVYFFVRDDPATYRLADSLDGEVERLADERREGELGHEYFQGLPGGKTAVFQVTVNDSSWIEGFDFETGLRKYLTPGMSPQVTSTGHIVFGTRDGAIMAATLDPRTLTMGTPVSVIDGPVDFYEGHYMWFRLARDGTLGYWERGTDEYEMVWVSRTGVPTPADPEWRFDPATYLWQPSWWLSPDGSRVAVSRMLEGALDIWTKEIPSGPETRLTRSSGLDYAPAWLSPDTLIFVTRATAVTTTSGRAPVAVVRQSADGAGDPTVIFEDARDIQVIVVAPDHERLLLSGNGDILQFRFGVDSVPIPLLATTEYQEGDPALSPDGRWLAYTTNETGRREVRVVSFPDTERGRWSVSANGGGSAVWSRDGSEIFYVAPDRTVMAARVETRPTFRVIDRHPLFPLPAEYAVPGDRPFADIGPDGRFLMMRGRTEQGFVLVQNFFEELKRLVPE